jgi:hypothetical protein
MRNFGFIAALLLVGSAFVLVAPASAEDVYECAGTETANACVYDTSNGNYEEACDEESGYYFGETGADAQVGSGPYADASAGGEESCYQSYWSGFVHDESVYAEADVCLEQDPGFYCSDRTSIDTEWTKEEIDIRVISSSEAGYAYVSVDWGETYDGCEASGFAFISGPTGYETESVSEDCPLTPPGPPNPGWGQVTP